MQILKLMMVSSLFGLSMFFFTFSDAKAELPPEILLDQYMIGAKEFYQKEDYEQALVNLQRIEKLNAAPPDTFYYIYGVVAFKTKDYVKTKQYLEKYLIQAGKTDPEKYKNALVLLSQSEVLHKQQIAAQEEAERKRIAAEQEAERQRIAAEKREKERLREERLKDCKDKCQARVDWLNMLIRNQQRWNDNLPDDVDTSEGDARIFELELEAETHWRKCSSACQNQYGSN